MRLWGRVGVEYVNEDENAPEYDCGEESSSLVSAGDSGECEITSGDSDLPASGKSGEE